VSQDAAAADPGPAIDAAEAAFVERLTGSLGRPNANSPRLIGAGSNNWVYRSESRRGPIALKLGKPHRARFATAEFRKELWCAAAARAAGVATPEAVETGVFEGRPFLVQAFCAGRAPGAAGEDLRPYWETLGRMARQIDAIAVTGWGPNLGEAAGAFDGIWRRHLAYNLDCLTPDDPLVGLGVFTPATSAAWRRELERLAALEVRMGLCHGDLAPWNLIVGDDGRATLIDWGCARAAPAPFQEFVETARAGRADAAAMEAFAAGYGLSSRAFSELRGTIAAFAALREVDTLRWALEHAPDVTPELTRHAAHALEALLTGA
jgi:Ser/Thr protein kinase RdoA (MazF antagonist)